MCALSLGVDTSNYTTSIALVDEKMKVIYNKGVLLDVKPGMLGLRQSDALFQHVENLPLLIKTLNLEDEIRVIACSDRPRPVINSYMPVFKAGVSMAESLSSILKIDCLKFSHQENHIRSALYGSGRVIKENNFCAIHFSGGTSEVLWVEKKKSGYNCRVMAKSLDLNAGQLIDRVGLKMGIAFPAGQELEALAKKANQNEDRIFINFTLCGSDFHFSGQENQAAKALELEVPREIVARQLFKSIADTLIQVIKRLMTEYSFQSILFSGGVMSNQLIKDWLTIGLKDTGFKLCFCPAEYARDNAIGNALMGMEYLKNKGRLWSIQKY